MSKIKVGEYVRTKEGYLGKLIAINKQDYNYLVVDTKIEIRHDNYPHTYLYLKNENIKNHSKDIIKLIEVGDYVNGMQIDSIDLKERKLFVAFGYDEIIIPENEIVTIVTKEQFEKVMYKVGD